MIKTIKRVLLFLLLFLLIGFVFRGWLYRTIVKYESLGERTVIKSNNPILINHFESLSPDPSEKNIEAIIDKALRLTSKQLSFSSQKKSADPLHLVKSGKTHCVGYAIYFSAICNYLIEKNRLSDQWKAKPQIGHLFLLGINIHNYFESPFFKDHDFVIIENRKTGVLYAVDPTVNDYLWIDRIAYRKKQQH